MINIKIGKKTIGHNFPSFIITEIGGLFKNFEEAKRLIDSAVNIGADAVKFQTYEAETMTTKKNMFDLGVTGHISQYDFFKKYQLPKELQKRIVSYANDKGIIIFSAPSHFKDIDFLKELNLPVYKIGSDLACHMPLLIEIAKLGKPMILSTGMCSMNEIEKSVRAILDTGNEQLALLHCVSDYPTKIEETNLSAIVSMQHEFDIPIGYSDHTEGIVIPIAASALGAMIIEKHFRHPANNAYPDDIHAADPEEFKNMIDSIRKIEKARGTGEKKPTVSELNNLKTNRVSIIALQNIQFGTIIDEKLIDVRRPGSGISPLHYYEILGKKTKINILKDEPITWDMIE